MFPRIASVLPQAVLVLALVGVSFGSIFVRLAAAPALAVALWRMTLAAALVVPVAGILRRPGAPSFGALLLAAAAGVLLALHFATWISSLDYTSVARSVLLVNTAPVFVALIAWIIGRDVPAPRIWVAIALALAGVVVMGAEGLDEPGAALGQALALAGAAAMAGYLVLAREAQRSLSYLSYVLTAYGSAAVCLWVAVAATGTVWHGFAAGTWVAIAAMALVSQVIGHGGYNWSLRHLQPAYVSLALTGEPVIAAALAWWLLGEPVSSGTAAGGALVLAAILLASRSRERRQEPDLS
jgi:drug/metabolite transporter (DMT)-like permease